MRVSENAQRVRIAQSDLRLLISEFRDEHDLTDVEVLQALNEYEASVLKYALRAERHPNDPDKFADEE